MYVVKDQILSDEKKVSVIGNLVEIEKTFSMSNYIRGLVARDKVAVTLETVTARALETSARELRWTTLALNSRIPEIRGYCHGQEIIQFYFLET